MFLLLVVRSVPELSRGGPKVNWWVILGVLFLLWLVMAIFQPKYAFAGAGGLGTLIFVLALAEVAIFGDGLSYSDDAVRSILFWTAGTLCVLYYVVGYVVVISGYLEKRARCLRPASFRRTDN